MKSKDPYPPADVGDSSNLAEDDICQDDNFKFNEDEATDSEIVIDDEAEEYEEEEEFTWEYDEESGEYYSLEPVESPEQMVVLEKGEDGSWETALQAKVNRYVLLDERYMNWYNIEQGFHYDQGSLTVLGSVGQTALLLDIFRQDGSDYRGVLMLEGGGSLQSLYCRMF